MPVTLPSLPDLFAQALELDEPGRSALLARTMQEDRPTGIELARLLASQAGPGSPIDRSPWRTFGANGLEAWSPPERVGPYRILRELGRGGMARVYLGEETTELFTRNLAVKVLERAPFADVAIRRFRDEVRILSSLEHRGIARFLDAGRTEDGIWFLALEHVEGEEILGWANRRGLPVRERVALFLHALEGVEHAHVRGVVHRDLKPGHLLVDAHGQPRLLDFGISKLIDPTTGAGHTATRTAARILTPAYASPEQFRGEPATPASDVYSLGAILYELLAGSRPFADVRQDSLERAVLERDAEAPSTIARRLATEAAGARTDPDTQPLRELTRDLDAICLKALRKVPADRYADASALAADLRAFFDGRPVAARRGGRVYRWHRFVRAHRQALLFAVTLLLAITATGLLLLRPAADGFFARAAPAPLPFPFSEIGSFDLEELRRQFAAAPENVEAGAKLGLRLLREPDPEAARLVLARLRQIPDQDRHPLVDYLEAQLAVHRDEPHRALVHLTRARDHALEAGRGDLLGQFRATRGRLLATLGRRDEAGEEMAAALRDFEATSDHASQSRVLNDLAIEHLQRGELDEGERLLERAIAEAVVADNFPGTMQYNLACLQIVRGRPDLAEARLRALVAARREGSNRRQLGEAIGRLGHAVGQQGRSAEALALLDESFGLLEANGASGQLEPLLHYAGELAIERADLSTATSLAGRLRRKSESAGEAVALALAIDLEARVQAAHGDPDESGPRFAEAARLLTESGELDAAAESGAAEAISLLRSASFVAAERAALGSPERLPPGAAQSRMVILARATRVRALVGQLRLAEAAALFDSLSDAAAAPALDIRSAYLLARAALDTAHGHFEAARRDVERVIAESRAAGRKLDELDARLELAALELAAGAMPAAAATAHDVARESRELGLGGLSLRAETIERLATSGRQR